MSRQTKIACARLLLEKPCSTKCLGMERSTWGECREKKKSRLRKRETSPCSTVRARVSYSCFRHECRGMEAMQVVSPGPAHTCHRKSKKKSHRQCSYDVLVVIGRVRYRSASLQGFGPRPQPEKQFYNRNSPIVQPLPVPAPLFETNPRPRREQPKGLPEEAEAHGLSIKETHRGHLPVYKISQKTKRTKLPSARAGRLPLREEYVAAGWTNCPGLFGAWRSAVRQTTVLLGFWVRDPRVRLRLPEQLDARRSLHGHAHCYLR